MTENTSDQAGQERRVGPTVSRDKWAHHAKLKLQRGYVLIVARDGKRSANFWQRDKGFEMCAYEVARHLITAGEVVAVGEHHLGTMYSLPEVSPDAPVAAPKKKKAPSPKPTAKPAGMPAVATAAS